MDGEELHGRDPQPLQVFDDRRRREGSVGPAQLLRDFRMPHGEPAHVGLVDDRLVPGNSWGTVVLPVEIVRHHHTLGNAGRVVGVVKGEVAIAMPQRVAESAALPVDLPMERPGVRVDEELVGVEA